MARWPESTPPIRHPPCGRRATHLVCNTGFLNVRWVMGYAPASGPEGIAVPTRVKLCRPFGTLKSRVWCLRRGRTLSPRGDIREIKQSW